MADHQMDGKTCERGRVEVGDEGKWTVQVMDGWMEGGLEENVSDAMGRDMPHAEETGGIRKEGEEFLMRRRRAQVANQAGCRAMEMGAPAVAATIFDVAMQAGCNKVERSEFQVNRKRDQEGATRIAGTGHPQARPTLVPAHARDKGKGKVGEDEMYRIPSPPDDGLKNEPKRVSALEDDALKVYYNAGLARLTAGDPLGAICAFRCAKKSWEGDPCFWIRVAEAYLEISDACIDSRSQLPPRRVQLVLGCQSEASFGMEAASHAADCLHRASLLLQHPYPAAVPGTAFYAQVDSAKVQSHVLMKLAYANLRIGATRAAVSYACQLLEMKDCPVTYQGLATLYWAESLATEEDFAAAHKVLSESLDSRQLSATLDKDTLSALKARLLDLEKLNACGPQPAAPSPLGAQPEVY